MLNGRRIFVVCIVCGSEFERRVKMQLICSQKCKSKKAHDNRVKSAEKEAERFNLTDYEKSHLTLGICYLPIETRVRVLRKTKYRCTYCGVKFGSIVKDTDKNTEVTVRVNWDRINPLTKGGSDDESNVVPACHLCNTIKYDRVFPDLDSARNFILPILLRRWPRIPKPVSVKVSIRFRQ